MQKWLNTEIAGIKEQGLYKNEKLIKSPQGSGVLTDSGDEINFCSNNYLGLANSEEIKSAVIKGLETYGYGMASVRFICGTQDIHKILEDKIATFIGTEDTILYSSCFDANAGVFETLLSKEDAVISDALNHASIIDGVRLCKAERKVYQHNSMDDLELRLQETQSSRFRLIVTDGVFSMHGDVANLPGICELADKYDALVMVDDSHATGFVGQNGKGTIEDQGVVGKIDIVTSTLGKALGGASGGFVTGRKEIVELLRQRSRPYLFSNTLAPPIVVGSIKALDIVQNKPELREKLWENTTYFRENLSQLGFDLVPGQHPIIPIMLGDEIKTVNLAESVNKQGVFVVGFSYPVVPKGEARIRVQMSAAHSKEQLDRALSVFEESGKKHSII
ncbi:MAG: glycine C-acetyltransferase [SAR202 cluster bacterium]|nr:glycine C-acetyltransferase [SAR202 cluster bacterium]